MSACHYSGSSIFSRAQPSSAPAQSLFELCQSFLAPQRHQNDSDMLGLCAIYPFSTSLQCLAFRLHLALFGFHHGPFACLLAMDLSGWHSSPGLGHVFSGLYNVIQFSSYGLCRFAIQHRKTQRNKDHNSNYSTRYDLWILMILFVVVSDSPRGCSLN